MPSTASSSPTKSPAKIPSTVVTSIQHPPTQHVPSTSRPHPSTANPQPQAPASTPATPCSRWETLYVYAFLVKFLPPAVSDLYDAMGCVYRSFCFLSAAHLRFFTDNRNVSRFPFTNTYRVRCGVRCLFRVRGCSSFEEAIASTGFNQILYDILYKFLSELRPSPEEPTTYVW